MRSYILAAVVVSMLGVAGGSQAADPPIIPTPLKLQTKAQLRSLPAAQQILLPNGSHTTAGALRTQFDESARGLGAKARVAAAAVGQQAAAASAGAGAALASHVVLLGSGSFREQHPPPPPGPPTGIGIPKGPSNEVDWCAEWNVKATICWSETVGAFDTSSIPGPKFPSSPWASEGPLVQTGSAYEVNFLAYPCIVLPPPPPPDPNKPPGPPHLNSGPDCTAPMLHPGFVVDHIVTKVVEGSPGAATAGPAGAGAIRVKFGSATPAPRTDAMLVWVYVKPATPVANALPPGPGVVVKQ